MLLDNLVTGEFCKEVRKETFGEDFEEGLGSEKVLVCLLGQPGFLGENAGVTEKNVEWF